MWKGCSLQCTADWSLIFASGGWFVAIICEACLYQEVGGWFGVCFRNSISSFQSESFVCRSLFRRFVKSISIGALRTKFQVLAKLLARIQEIKK